LLVSILLYTLNSSWNTTRLMFKYWYTNWTVFFSVSTSSGTFFWFWSSWSLYSLLIRFLWLVDFMKGNFLFFGSWFHQPSNVSPIQTIFLAYRLHNFSPSIVTWLGSVCSLARLQAVIFFYFWKVILVGYCFLNWSIFFGMSTWKWKGSFSFLGSLNRQLS
jgi:hypothetical protein